MPITPELRTKLETLIASDDVVLFMKGSKSFPQCGFSASVVSILNTLVPKYTTVNVLSDPDIRNGIKEFSDWPTIPQLYIKGEFVGGSDIVKQMHEAGELAAKIGVVAAPAAPVAAPSIKVSAAAAAILSEALTDGGPGSVIHLTVDARFEHGLDVGPADAQSLSFEASGVPFQIAKGDAARAANLVIDFVEGPGGAGFKIDNPQRPAAVRQVTPKELKALLDSGAVKELFDVRTPAERERALIKGAVLLDDGVFKRIEGLPKSTPIAFHCHHGGRSQSAAEHFLKLGFTNVYNLTGGIDAWSREVDPTVPKY
jgi:monothiol glutaredoxin